MKETILKNAWLTALIGFVIPGGGHIYQGRWGRGGALGICVLFCFGLGLWLGGHLFSFGTDQGTSAATLLRVPPIFANLGVGLPYILSWLTNVGFMENAKRYTFEYGNTFLLIAGLLNYLTVLDSFDIAKGRKS